MVIKSEIARLAERSSPGWHPKLISNAVRKRRAFPHDHCNCCVYELGTASGPGSQYCLINDCAKIGGVPGNGLLDYLAAIAPEAISKAPKPKRKSSRAECCLPIKAQFPPNSKGWDR